MHDADRSLAKLLVQRSYLEGDFVLSSGRRSSFYFDCRLSTCHAQALPLIAQSFLDAFERAGTRPRSVGGMTSGADPIANAIAYHSLTSGAPIDAFSVRKDRKQHGTGKWIEGCAASPLALVDDVVTSGGSVLRSLECCREEGWEIAHVTVLVDREEGGMQAISDAAGEIPVSAIFTRAELERLRDEERGS